MSPTGRPEGEPRALQRAGSPVTERIVVGMSGGVDSSVAALLLRQQGYEVVGLFMKNWEDDDDDEYCSTREDLVDVASVADVLGIELEVVNFAAEYKDRVFASFLAEYAAGRTPNPDVLCNAEIKFKAFLDHALAMGASRIATGHYAGVREADGRYELVKGADRHQGPELLPPPAHPGAARAGRVPARRPREDRSAPDRPRGGPAGAREKDSTGICFIGERPFREFLNRYLPRAPGPMRTPEGATVGEHIGLAFYTIGQRSGLGIGGTRDGDGAPWYVAGKDRERNELIVVQGHDHPLLQRRALTAADLAWVSGEPPAPGATYGGKTRYRQADAACRIARLDADACAVEFDDPQWAVTPGQSVVSLPGRGVPRRRGDPVIG